MVRGLGVPHRSVAIVAAICAQLALFAVSAPGCASDAGIVCGEEVCSLCCNAGECRATEATCLDGFDQGGRLILKCDGPEDCGAGETCCAGLPGGSFAVIASCSSIDACAALPAPMYVCHDDADCRPGERCVAAPFDLGFTSCQ